MGDAALDSVKVAAVVLPATAIKTVTDLVTVAQTSLKSAVFLVSKIAIKIHVACGQLFAYVHMMSTYLCLNHLPCSFFLCINFVILLNFVGVESGSGSGSGSGISPPTSKSMQSYMCATMIMLFQFRMLSW